MTQPALSLDPDISIITIYREISMKQLFVAIALPLALFAATSHAETELERGRYLVETLAACGNCHTPKGPNGPVPSKKFAGGDVIKHADFTAVTPNITPDPETGIGRWTD